MVRNIKLASIFVLVVSSIAFGMILAEGLGTDFLGRRGDVAETESWAPGTTALASEVEAATPGSFADVVERVNSAVVFVQVTEVGRRPPGFGGNGPGGNLWDFFREPEGEPGEEFRREGGGSGFIIDKDGWILTNHHVIEDATRVVIKMADDRELEAEVRGTDRLLDVALLKVESKEDLPVVALGDSEKMRVGDWVLAIGNPFIYEHTVTAGVVSHKGRSQAGNPFQRYIQTDAAINFGNSGGPLLNVRGEVVGINTAISAVGQNIGFAIPINTVKTIMGELKETGRVARGFLGVNPQEIDDKLRKAFPGLPTSKGALVVVVEEDSPADKAGMKVDDVIVEFDGEPIRSREDLFRVVAATPPGTDVKVKVLREDGRGSGKWVEKTLSTELIERPEAGEAPAESPRRPGRRELPGKKLGLQVDEIPREARERLGVPAGVSGVVVVKVEASGPSADAGISQGDVIAQVNGVTVDGIDEFADALADVEAGSLLRLRLYHQGVPRYVAVEVRE